MPPEFFKLAAIWLACRWDQINEPGANRALCLIGELDYHAEMLILIEEARP